MGIMFNFNNSTNNKYSVGFAAQKTLIINFHTRQFTMIIDYILTKRIGVSNKNLFFIII